MQLLGAEQLAASLHIVTVLAPIAIYFFVLGYLNTRRRPVLLTARQDSSILVVSLSPLALGPIVQGLGGGWVALVVATAMLVAGVLLLAPRGASWVIYNLSIEQGRRIILDAVEKIDPDAKVHSPYIDLPTRGAKIELTGFPVLRNVSIRVIDGDDALAGEIEHRLTARLSRQETAPAPMAVTLLLLATAMLVAPAALMLHHAPEIVRLLTDMLP